MIDEINKATWSDPETLAEFANLSAWTDVAERAVLMQIAPEIREQPVLDIGIGAGRTTALLCLLTSNYVGIDYTPGMVALAANAFPDRDIRDGDARDLEAFGDGQFALTMFSFSGIDCLERNDRLRALAEMTRVTKPGGLLLYSTHNKGGPGYLEPPWVAHRRPGKQWFRAMRYVARLPEDGRDRLAAYHRWRAMRRMQEEHDGWGMAPLSAHGYGLLIHFTDLDAELATLRDLGYADIKAYDRETGTLIQPGQASSTRWFQLLARKS